MPKAMQKALKMSNQQWVQKLAGLDCNVMDYSKDLNGSDHDFTFESSKNISSEMLFVFFSYVTGCEGERYPRNYSLKWYDEKDKKFHIPVSDIVAVLDTYFNGVNFDPTKINGYNEKTNTIDGIIDGFGGANYPKFIKEEVLSNNALRITVRYYTSDDYKSVRYTKEYTIRYTDGGYKYLSIIKK